MCLILFNVDVCHLILEKNTSMKTFSMSLLFRRVDERINVPWLYVLKNRYEHQYLKKTSILKFINIPRIHAESYLKENLYDSVML